MRVRPFSLAFVMPAIQMAALPTVDERKTIYMACIEYHRGIMASLVTSSSPPVLHLALSARCARSLWADERASDWLDSCCSLVQCDCIKLRFSYQEQLDFVAIERICCQIHGRNESYRERGENRIAEISPCTTTANNKKRWSSDVGSRRPIHTCVNETCVCVCIVTTWLSKAAPSVKSTKTTSLQVALLY